VTAIEPQAARPVRIDRRKEVAAVRHWQAVQGAGTDYVLRAAAGRQPARAAPKPRRASGRPRLPSAGNNTTKGWVEDRWIVANTANLQLIIIHKLERFVPSAHTDIRDTV
jgi:hypothetical protein